MVNAARIAGRYDERRRGLGVGQRARSSVATRRSGRRHTTGSLGGQVERHSRQRGFFGSRAVPLRRRTGSFRGAWTRSDALAVCRLSFGSMCGRRESGLSGGSPKGAQRVRDEDVDGGHSRSQSSGTWFYGIVLARGKWRSDEIFGSDRGAQPGTRSCLPAPSGSAARLVFAHHSSEGCTGRGTHAKDGRVGDAWARSLQ